MGVAVQSMVLSGPDKARMLAIGDNDQKSQMLSHERHSLTKLL
jgi:hypothetical protein